MKPLKQLVMEKVKTYWFAKQGLEGYANPTEPNLYPHAFEAMVKKSEYERALDLLEQAEGSLDKINKFSREIISVAESEQTLQAIQSFKKEMGGG